MANTVNIHEAKSRLSELLALVERGQDVTIARAGKPIARLVAIGRGRKRKLGMLEGKVAIPAAIIEPLPPDVVALLAGDA
ncbi:MAG: type II toxin-antitoxin system prevent-host-death family antitoxin [Proteobacteria bacterium]|nr:type II toxin-antitoxin system prevent-host-death family antitoxin [Pseudomonadota bacterium]MBS0464433.1 type II toxin-antitoxin system prevent-host-death family antitoxin [Pseudomonadota bacterium]